MVLVEERAMFGGRGFSKQEYGHSGRGRGRGSEELHGGVPLGGVENIGAPRLGGGGGGTLTELR